MSRVINRAVQDSGETNFIDMNEVTLKAVTSKRKLNNGLEIAITGEG